MCHWSVYLFVTTLAASVLSAKESTMLRQRSSARSWSIEMLPLIAVPRLTARGASRYITVCDQCVGVSLGVVPRRCGGAMCKRQPCV